MAGVDMLWTGALSGWKILRRLHEVATWGEALGLVVGREEVGEIKVWLDGHSSPMRVDQTIWESNYVVPLDTIFHILIPLSRLSVAPLNQSQ